MTTEYIGYIKKTKSDKYRSALGSLHDVGEPDGDRSVYEVATSPLFENLQEAIDDLINNCEMSNIKKYSIVPIVRKQILFESELKLLT